jgi:hypothetical protein
MDGTLIVKSCKLKAPTAADDDSIWADDPPHGDD